jgi:molecular chaperone DnaK
VEEKITHLRKLLAEDASTEDLKSATNDLLTSSQAIGQMIYEQAAAAAGEGESAPESGGDDDVVEAEIVDEGEES